MKIETINISNQKLFHSISKWTKENENNFSHMTAVQMCLYISTFLAIATPDVTRGHPS